MCVIPMALKMFSVGFADFLSYYKFLVHKALVVELNIMAEIDVLIMLVPLHCFYFCGLFLLSSLETYYTTWFHN